MVVLKNIIPSYQGFINSTYGASYLRHWVGHSLTRIYTPANISDGSAIPTLRANHIQARQAGQLVVDRFMFNSNHDLLSAVGMQATPEQLASGFHVADLRHAPTKQKRRDLVFKHRDAMHDVIDVAQWGAGVHNEMNFPGTFPFSTDILLEDFEMFWEAWGKKTSISIGGSSTYMAAFLAQVGAKGAGNRPEWDHQDSYGRERWSSMYAMRYTQLGYRPLCSWRETSGGPNAWDDLGLDPLSLYREFLDKKYTILANMGAFLDYVTVDPTTAEFLSMALHYAQDQIADYFAFLGQDEPPPGDGGGDESWQTLTIPPDKHVASIRINYDTGDPIL